MIEIQAITDHISCFKVPYKDIFVGIYIVRTDNGIVLFDTAACGEDVDSYILPALQQQGVTPTHIFISHNHNDHSGGLARAAALFPNATILSRSATLKQTYPGIHCPQDGEMLMDTLQVVTIPGHTEDSAALFDLRTNTLVSGDCLQVYGIYGSGFWYGNITFPAEYFAAIEKLRSLPIDTIATAHDYHPCGMVSNGKAQVAQCLDGCVSALCRVRDIMDANPGLEDAQIAELCNDGTLPKIAPKVITALRAAAAAGKI